MQCVGSQAVMLRKKLRAQDGSAIFKEEHLLRRAFSRRNSIAFGFKSLA